MNHIPLFPGVFLLFAPFAPFGAEAAAKSDIVFILADDRIGEVLAALDRLKLTERTLVIYSADNGPVRGGVDGT
jgi:hypothetical protein